MPHTDAARSRLQRTVTAMVSLVAVAASLAACSEGIEVAPPQGLDCPLATGPLSIAYGARANTPNPGLPQPIGAALQLAVKDRQAISVFRVDGKPSRVFQGTFESPAKNDQALRDDFNRFLGDITQALAGVRSEVDEADTLAGLTLAGRAAGPGGTVVLMDSGLQTTAPLDFVRSQLLDAVPAEVVTFLQTAKLMPDLAGRTVIMAGLGNTVPPQDELDTRRHNNVIEIWKAIASEAGAMCVAVVDKPGGSRTVDGLAHTVTPVPIPAEESWISCGQTILDNTSRVGFKPDQDVFIDPAGAQTALTELANIMKAGRQRAELIGTTATDGTEAGRLALSLQRAEAVKRVLVRLGVAGERITTRGVGTHFETHENDIGPNGELLPGPAQRNRSVVVRLTCPQ